MDVPPPTCPVPIEQRPINEYQSLKESCFFHWATRELAGYLTAIVWIVGISLLVTGPIAANSFSPTECVGQFALSALAGAGVVLALTLLRLYLGWSYICDRLLSETVFYEETGWYDGQIWLKPPEEQVKDRLVVIHQVRPVLQRLRWTFGFLSVSVLAGCTFWTLI